MGHDVRRIHAANDEYEIVRYDRAGKWYLEYDAPKKRHPLSIGEAAAEARAIARRGGRIFFGLPGGGAFDRMVRDAFGKAA